MGLAKAVLTSFLLLTVLCMIACGGVASAAAPNSTNPQITSVTPSTARVATSVNLQVAGENFTTDSQIVWNGVAKKTTYVSSELLTTTLSSTDVAQPTDGTLYVNSPRANSQSNKTHIKVVQPLAITSSTLSSAVTGSGYSTSLTGSGGSKPYTWGAGSTLPAGLTLSSNGQLSGTPTAAGSYSFTVNLKDNSNPNQSASKSLSLSINSQTSQLTVGSTTLPGATVGQAYTATLGASGGTSPYAWTATTALPAGLALSANGVLSGSPTATGTFTIGVSVSDSSSTKQTATGSFKVTVVAAAAPLVIATTSFPAATVGTSFSSTLSASGGSSPYVWSATTAVPTGLVLNSNGTLSGTPSAAGTFNIGVKVVDNAVPSQSASKTLSLAVAAAPTAPLSITTTSVPNGTSGQSYNVSLLASGGSTPYAWTATTSLPAGISLGSNGSLSGTPSASGTFTIGVKVSDSSSTVKTATASYTLTVAAAAPTAVSITTTSVPSGTSGTGYAYGLNATGGTTPYGWSLAAGQLPSGMSLTSTGSLAGTPSATGTFNFTAKVSDANNSSDTAAFSLTVSSASSSSGNAPALPKVYVDTTYPAITGKTIAVHAGGDLQAAIDAAVPGDQIVIDAGVTITGANFFLRKKAGQDSNPSYIVIRSSGTLPSPGTRVAQTDASQMAKIQSNSTDPVFRTEYGAHNYRLVGLEITKIASPTVNAYSNLSYGLIWIGGPDYYTGKYPASTSDLPHHIVLDRCYIHGDYNAPHGETYRASMVNGDYIGVVDSYISNIHSEYLEVQGLEGGNSNGPIKIVNNYVEAAGENIIFGGFDPAVPNAVPSDIEVRHNYLSKPMSWNPYSSSFAGVSYSVKNLFELKNAQRVWVDGNIMGNNWVKSQDGKAVLFTVRNQSGGCPWCTVQDITFTNNIVRQTAGVFNTIAADYNHPSQQLQSVLIENNLFYSIGGAQWGDTGGYGIFASVNGGQWPGGPHYTILNMTFNHNTAFPTKDVLEMDIAPAATNLVFTNNLVASGSYGIFGSGYGTGTPAINQYLVSPTFNANVMAGAGAVGTYPTGVQLLSSISSIGFVNYSGNDFHLSTSSPYKNAGTDGKDMGADVDGIASKTSCVLKGVSCQ